MAWKLTPLLLLVWIASTCSARDRTDLINVCMDAKHHKTKPGPEDKLHNLAWLECGSGWGGGAGSKREQEIKVVGEGFRSQIPPYPELLLWVKMKVGSG